MTSGDRRPRRSASGRGGAPFDRVAAQAFSSFTDATVATGAELAEPVFVRSRSGPGAGEVGFATSRSGWRRSRAVSSSANRAGTYAENVQFVVGDHAHLTVVNVHDWPMTPCTAAYIGVGRDAIVRHFAVSLGGNLVPALALVRYHAPGGDVELWPVLRRRRPGSTSIASGRRSQPAPPPFQREFVQGALQSDFGSWRPVAGSVHTVWIGDVLIPPRGRGHRHLQSSTRNLVLTDGACADSVPNLEIRDRRDRRAGHASATGRFDDEATVLPAVTSGISEAEARRLVILGFFGRSSSRSVSRRSVSAWPTRSRKNSNSSSCDGTAYSPPHSRSK